MEPIIVVHALTAAFVLALGPVNLVRRRRDRAHRFIGRTWVVAMGLTCASSFAIHPHGFSWLHGLAVFTLISVGVAVVQIGRGNVPSHRANMIGSYLGTCIAFVFAATMPNRAIARMAVNSPLTMLAAATLVAATSAAFASLVIRTRGGRSRRPRDRRVGGGAARSSASAPWRRQ